jgi:hypothetical protein
VGAVELDAETEAEVLGRGLRRAGSFRQATVARMIAPSDNEIGLEIESQVLSMLALLGFFIEPLMVNSHRAVSHAFVGPSFRRLLQRER